MEPDCVVIFEDMTYKTGSLISMEMFDLFLAPYYVRLIDFLKQYGIKNIIVDSDGLVDQLVPRWLELGVTGITPMEAVNNIVQLRREYPRMQMMGGIDKRVLIYGTKEQIDQELQKVRVLLPDGGYIPHIDHAVPMDAKWESFVYYRNRLNDIIDEHSAK
jgi:uroporphyrinogen decarboxylase